LTTDGELLRRYVREGDESAFGEIAGRHGPMVLAACRRMVPREAEDAAQAVFMLLAGKARRLVGKKELGPWLYSACAFVARASRRERFRRRAREREAAVMRRDVPADAGAEAVNAEAAGHLDEAVQALPERYRKVVVLCYMEGASQSEAAERLGLPLGTVAARRGRALERLRKHLGRRGVSLSAAALGALLLEGTTAAAASLPKAGLLPSALAASQVAAAGAGAGAAGVHAAMLAKGAMQMMFWSKVKTCAALFGALAVCGVAVPVAGRLIGTAAEPAALSAPEVTTDKPAALPGKPPVLPGLKPIVKTEPTVLQKVPGATVRADLVAVVKVVEVSKGKASAELAKDLAGKRLGALDKVLTADVLQTIKGKVTAKRIKIKFTTCNIPVRGPVALVCVPVPLVNAAGKMVGSLNQYFYGAFAPTKGQRLLVFLEQEAGDQFSLALPVLNGTPADSLKAAKEAAKVVAEWESDPKLTKKQEAAIDELVGQLGDPDFNTRESATKALIAMGAIVRGKARAALASKDAETRSRARRILDALRPACYSDAGFGAKKISVKSDTPGITSSAFCGQEDVIQNIQIKVSQ
jgi:RNA polymerase sigma factor (sigma-70 family)